MGRTHEGPLVQTKADSRNPKLGALEKPFPQLIALFGLLIVEFLIWRFLVFQLVYRISTPVVHLRCHPATPNSHGSS